MDDLIGRIVGQKYRILRTVGSGGMADVYEAAHVEIGGRLIVKVIKKEFACVASLCERFQVEARTAASIGHPGIVQIFDVGEVAPGRPYMVMEYLHGETLADMEKRTKKFGEREAAGLCIHVLDALHAAHEAGVLHRDIKPENVFLVRSGDGHAWAKIIDFGIARLTADPVGPTRKTQQGMILGTPYYISPEQARGVENIDARSDIYAVGIMLFEMLTGALPFGGDSMVEILTKVLSDPFPPPRSVEPSISVEMENVILRATARKRSERYEGAREFAAALRPFTLTVAVEIVADAEEDADVSSFRRLRDLACSPPSMTTGPRLPTAGRASAPPSPLAGRSTPLGGLTPPPPPPMRRSSVHSSFAGATPAHGILAVSRRWMLVGGVTAGFLLLVLAAIAILLSTRTPTGPSGGTPAATASPTLPAASVADVGAPAATESEAQLAPAPGPSASQDADSVDAASTSPPSSGASAAGEAGAHEAGSALVATVRLRGLPHGGRATVDGDAVGVEFRLEVSDASHVLRVEAPGREPFESTFWVSGDMEIEIKMPFPASTGGARPARDAGRARDGELAENPFANP